MQIARNALQLGTKFAGNIDLIMNEFLVLILL